MSEFSRWLTRKYPEYLLEQDAPMQQNAPAQSAAEILRQRLQKKAAGGQGGTPMQQNQDAAQAAAERLKQRMQQRQNAGTGAAAAGAGANPNASNEVKTGFNEEYGEYVRKIGEKHNNQCTENLGNYIKWMSTELNKKNDPYSDVRQWGYGFPDNIFEDWLINYHPINITKLDYVVNRWRIIGRIIQNEDKENLVNRGKKTVYNFLLENPQIIDKFISEIDKEVKKLENSFERGQLCVKETLKIEKYKTDKLLDLKNKIIKIKGNSPDSSGQGGTR